MALGVEPARPGIMEEPPRRSEARILTLARFWHLFGYGSIMAAGTIGVFSHGFSSGGLEQASTLAFTTFVLFQFFNAMNARNETGSAFNRQLFANGKLWLALVAVLVLQLVAVHLGPAQAVFHTVGLSVTDWLLAAAVAAGVLVLEEARKLAVRGLSRRG
jgi:P-type Ca2+ transporter type 2C